MESSIGAIKPAFNELTADIQNGRARSSAAEGVPANQEAQDATRVQQGLDVYQAEANSPVEEEGVNQSNAPEDLENAIETVSSFIEPQIRNVNFTQDDTSGQTVIKVFDAQSRELIKQFPSDEILELAERIKGLQEEIVDKTGILIDDKV